MSQGTNTKQQGSRDQTKTRELVTLIVRLATFLVTLVPLLAMIRPWVTLDGIDEPVSGVGAIALLLLPIREYLFAVSPLQAAVVTLGPILAALLAILISNSYRRRKSVIWAPPGMLAVALGIAYGATDLVTGTEQGLTIVMVVSTLLTLHQVAIRVQVALQRKLMMPAVYRVLTVATGTGRYRWREW